MAAPTTHAIEHRIVIGTSARRATSAFFDGSDLASWWHAVVSVTVPAPLGPFAVQWRPGHDVDEVLGRLGGTLAGTVMDFEADTSFFVANAYWHPPEGDPIGPMAIAVQVWPHADGVEVIVRQSADGEGSRWARYFDIMRGGWDDALRNLKVYLEGLEALERSM